MNYSQLRKCVANHGDKAFTDHVFAINNEFGLIAIVYADHVQDALDAAADSGHLNGQRMSDDDWQEYESNEWHDSFMLLGNASEPFWSEYLGINQLHR